MYFDKIFLMDISKIFSDFRVNDIFIIQEQNDQTNENIQMVVLEKDFLKYILIVRCDKIYTFGKDLDIDLGKIFCNNNFKVHSYIDKPGNELETVIGNKNRNRSLKVCSCIYESDIVNTTNKTTLAEFKLNKSKIIDLFIEAGKSGHFKYNFGNNSNLEFVVKLNVSNFEFFNGPNKYVYLYSNSIRFNYMCKKSKVIFSIGEQVISKQYGQHEQYEQSEEDKEISEFNVNDMTVNKITQLIMSLTNLINKFDRPL